MSQTDVEVVALGRVLDEGRGSLPFALVHGEALVTCATWALAEAGVLPIDARTSIEGVLDAGLPLVLHDSLCPMTPPPFIAECALRSADDGVVVVGVRPVTDTVKVLTGRSLGTTVDRQTLARVVSPVVVPPDRAAQAADLLVDPGLDLARLAEALRAHGPVLLLGAPPEAMRVGAPDDVRILAALTRPA